MMGPRRRHVVYFDASKHLSAPTKILLFKSKEYTMLYLSNVFIPHQSLITVDIIIHSLLGLTLFHKFEGIDHRRLEFVFTHITGLENYFVVHSSCRTSDLEFSLVLHDNPLVLVKHNKTSSVCVYSFLSPAGKIFCTTISHALTHCLLRPV